MRWMWVALPLAAAALIGSVPSGARLPGTNGMIAVAVGEAGSSQSYVDVVKADGTARQWHVLTGVLSTRWSPDGRRFVAVTTPDRSLVVMNGDGSGRRTLAQNAEWASWSPTGNQVTFGSLTIPRGTHVINVDGTGDRLVVEGGGQPVWSPDGAKIAYTKRVSGIANNDIWSINVDGSGETRLTTDRASDSRPDWSPDGRKIVFSSYRDVTSPLAPFTTELYVMNADGSAQTRLTNSPGEDDAPVWSPDGSKIAFSTDRDGRYQVYVMNADGSAPTNISRSTTGEGPPWDWQPTLDLALSASIRPKATRVGRTTAVTVTVHNTGPASASVVKVTMRITGRAKVVTAKVAGGSCRATARTCTIPTLAAGARARVTFALKGTRPGRVTARASVAAAQVDPAPANDGATVRATIKK